jgi:hypothetical protein
MTEKGQISDLLKKVLDQLEHSEAKENKTDYEFIMQEVETITVEGNFFEDFLKSNVILNFEGKDECGFRDQQAIKLTPFEAIELRKALNEALNHFAQKGMALLKRKGVK